VICSIWDIGVDPRDVRSLYELEGSTFDGTWARSTWSSYAST